MENLRSIRVSDGRSADASLQASLQRTGRAETLAYHLWCKHEAAVDAAVRSNAGGTAGNYWYTLSGGSDRLSAEDAGAGMRCAVHLAVTDVEAFIEPPHVCEYVPSPAWPVMPEYAGRFEAGDVKFVVTLEYGFEALFRAALDRCLSGAWPGHPLPPCIDAVYVGDRVPWHDDQTFKALLILKGVPPSEFEIGPWEWFLRNVVGSINRFHDAQRYAEMAERHGIRVLYDGAVTGLLSDLFPLGVRATVSPQWVSETPFFRAFRYSIANRHPIEIGTWRCAYVEDMFAHWLNGPGCFRIVSRSFRPKGPSA